MAPNAEKSPIADVFARQEVSFAKKGIWIAMFSAALWGIYAVIISLAYGFVPLNTEGTSILTIPIVVGALHELAAFLVFTFRNGKDGKLPEYLRAVRTVPGKVVLIGGVVGGPFALTCSMAGILFAGPAYSLAITSLYPVIGALLAVLFLKEKTNLRFWIGILCCVLGGAVLGFSHPDGNYPHFYLGILFSLLAAFGWGAEGTIGAFGTDTLDPNVSVGLRNCASTFVYLVLVPIFGGTKIFLDAIFLHPQAFGMVALAALAGSSSLWYWYIAFGMTGVSRAMAINSTYSLWGIVFTLFLSLTGVTHFTLTGQLAVGVAIMIVGIALVVANPKELLRLRNN